ESAARGQADLREVRCFRYSNLSVRRDQLCFGLANFGPPLQRVGGKPRGNLRRMRLFRQLRSARDGTWIVTQKCADEVFLLLNTSLQIGNGFGGSEYHLLRLPDVKHG